MQASYSLHSIAWIVLHHTLTVDWSFLSGDPMSVPQVVIVGRPNVGKSQPVQLARRRRIAIVDDQAGVTRDRVTHLMEHDDRFFELVDTGGMGIEDVDNLTQQVEEQIDTAIDSADVILFVVDTRDGMLPLDQDVARRLRYVDKPVICVANKSDDEQLDYAGRRILPARPRQADPGQHACRTAASTSCST